MSKLIGITSLVLPHPVNVKSVPGETNKVSNLYTQIVRKTFSKYGSNQATVTNNLVAAYKHLLAHGNLVDIEALVKSADIGCLVDALLENKFGTDPKEQLKVGLQLFDIWLESEKVVKLVDFLLAACLKLETLDSSKTPAESILRNVLLYDAHCNKQAYPTVKTRKGLINHPVIKPVFDQLNSDYKTFYIANPNVSKYYTILGGSRLPMNIDYAFYHTTQQASKWQNLNK